MDNFVLDSLEDRLAVSFDRLKQDLAERGLSRLLWQFRRSPVITQVVKKLCEEFQKTYDDEIEVLQGRTLAEAEGVNLDIIGSLVGQPRQMKNIQTNDDNYRRFIFAKILKNHTHSGSLIEVRYFAQFISGIPISFVKIGIQSYRFIVQYGFNEDPEVLNAIRLLVYFWKNTEIDNFYLAPVPATVFIDTDIIIVTPDDPDMNWFGPDLQDRRVDYAKVAVDANIGGL